jgi:hypothetical protein
MTYLWNFYDFFMNFGLIFRPIHGEIKIGVNGAPIAKPLAKARRAGRE